MQRKCQNDVDHGEEYSETNLHLGIVPPHLTSHVSSVGNCDIMLVNVHLSRHQAVLVRSNVSSVRTTDMFNATDRKFFK